MRRGRRKALYRIKRDFLDGPHEKAEIKRKAPTRRKNSVFSQDTYLEKERVRSKVTLRKVEVGFKRKQDLNQRTLGWRLGWWGSTEKKGGFTFAVGKGKTPVLRPIL